MGVLVVDVIMIVNLSAETRAFDNCTLNVEGSRKSNSIVSRVVRDTVGQG